MDSHRGTGLALATGSAGVVGLLSGLATDAWLHARNPALTHTESIWTLTNPGHALLAVGIGLVVVGLSAATYLHLRTSSRRFARPLAVRLAGVTVLALVVASVGTVRWAATTEATAGSHAHAAADPAADSAVPVGGDAVDLDAIRELSLGGGAHHGVTSAPVRRACTGGFDTRGDR